MSDGAGGIYLRAGGLYPTSFGTDWLLDHMTVIIRIPGRGNRIIGIAANCNALEPHCGQCSDWNCDRRDDSLVAVS